jgi:hypothetical protein
MAIGAAIGKRSGYVPNYMKKDADKSINRLDGIYVGTVTSNEDFLYLGRIEIRIGTLLTGGDPDALNNEDGYRVVSVISQYGGATDPRETIDDRTIYGEEATSVNGTVKTFGIWTQPPVVGSEVVVAFMSSRQEGILLGTMITMDRNHMIGGRASGRTFPGQGNSADIGPTGERNPKDTDRDPRRPGDAKAYAYLKEQGLTEDYARGHSESSPRRETPSNMFGITTMYGHTLTMDDGDEKGSSKNIRIRSQNGAQILIDDTNKYIFVNNHDGSSWVEIDEHGNVDVYAKGNISMHTEKDFNVHAKGNINMEAERNIFMKAEGSQGIKAYASSSDIDLKAAVDIKIQADNTTNIRANHHIETAGRIDMNGPQAKSALAPVENNLPMNKNITVSVSTRVPEHHPWEGASKIQKTFNADNGPVV